MENAEKKVSVSFSFKKKADTRGYVKPKEEPLKVIKEDYITCIEGDKIVSQGGGSGGGEESSSKLVIPLPQGAKISEEPSENSYEVVPVEEFGLAMLRGMGWTENDDRIKPIETIIRPKGSGLGHLSLNRK